MWGCGALLRDLGNVDSYSGIGDKMTWTIKEKPETLQHFVRIHCFTCKKDVARKTELPKHHRGHDVHYVNKDGVPCD